MIHTNCQFPIIDYRCSISDFEKGFIHGESYKTAIKELVEIRKSLMLSKNPRLSSSLEELALEQFRISSLYAPEIAQEIKGISEGANVTLTDIVILNNYTDFRDIILPEEGCSTIHLQKGEFITSGQTWDMHRSAKNYLCVLNIEGDNNHPSQLILSLVGCVGLMGINSHQCFIGVNNINTTNAKTGLIWPLLVRKTLAAKSLSEMQHTLLNAPVTSGHNYLISSPEGAEHLEITPTVKDKVSYIVKGKDGAIFHTNHCLGQNVKNIEDKSSLSSTTFQRYDLLQRKVTSIENFSSFFSLLTDHEEFPKSICSHFENGAQDPSFTCGGGIFDFSKGKIVFWRGCIHYDSDYIEHTFSLSNNLFLHKR